MALTSRALRCNSLGPEIGQQGTPPAHTTKGDRQLKQTAKHGRSDVCLARHMAFGSVEGTGIGEGRPACDRAKRSYAPATKQRAAEAPATRPSGNPDMPNRPAESSGRLVRPCLSGYDAAVICAASFAWENTMYTKQVSVFLENKKGRLAEVTRLLRDEGINIRALSLADMPDLGVLRLIVDDRARCLRALKSHDLVAQETDVIAVEIEDKPGGLHEIVEVFDRENINIEYMYTFFRKSVGSAIVVFKMDNPALATDTLRKNGITILPEDAIQNL